MGFWVCEESLNFLGSDEAMCDERSLRLPGEKETVAETLGGGVVIGLSALEEEDGEEGGCADDGDG